MKYEDIKFKVWVRAHNRIGERQIVEISDRYKRKDVVNLLDKIGIPVKWTSPYSWGKRERNFPLTKTELDALEEHTLFRLGEYHHEPIVFIQRQQ